MSGFSIALLLANFVAILALPRRWAPLPLLIGACYITRNQLIEVGPLHFTSVRILILAGLVRIIIRGGTLVGRMNVLDSMVLVWAVWMLLSSSFHENSSATLITRLGETYDACGFYFLIRVFCQQREDVVGLCRLLAFILVPIAIEMIYEKVTDNNLFYLLGGTSLPHYIRQGHIRAQGPFAHAINGGTVGAVCLPLMILLWQSHRKVAVSGIVACLVIIFTSASSGPIISGMAAIAALLMWNYRHLTRATRWTAVGVYVLLDLVMKDPAYYIIARIDLAGGSASWHRARLIQAAIEHLPEWWLVGTDYTRHWMPTGVSWHPNHTDITNQYILMGVMGGLPLMVLFIAILVGGFSLVGQAVRQMSESSRHSRFVMWAIGASLFAHATTFISVAYFDQTVVFLYLTLGAIGSLWSLTVREKCRVISSRAISNRLALSNSA